MIFSQHLKWLKTYHKVLVNALKPSLHPLTKLSIEFKVSVICLKGRHILEAD